MRKLIKISLLAILSAPYVGALMPRAAWAGNAPVVPGGSDGANVGESFNNGYRNISRTSTTAIRRAIVDVLQKIEDSNGAITSPSGVRLVLTTEQETVILNALTANGTNVQPAFTALKLQIAAELGIEAGSFGLLASNRTPATLESTIEAFNAFVRSLTGQPLQKALVSPTLITLREGLLRAKDSRCRREGGRCSDDNAAATNLPVFSVDPVP